MLGQDYVGYGEHPPNVTWPDGRRVALSVVVNYEEGAEHSLALGDVNGETLGEFGNFPAAGDGRDRSTESFFEYGSRVGVWRLLRVLRDADVPATFFVCARAFERNPAVAARVVADGHEVCYHGYRWAAHVGLSAEQELNTIQLALESFQRVIGSRPVGSFVNGGVTEHTRDLLVQLGFLYDSNSYSDELPYYVGAHGRPHLVLPYAADTNDIRMWSAPGPGAGRHYCDLLITTLDRHLVEADDRPAMMSVGLHARISGRPERAAALAEFLSYARTKPQVWIARRENIARWWLQISPPTRDESRSRDC